MTDEEIRALVEACRRNDCTVLVTSVENEAGAKGSAVAFGYESVWKLGAEVIALRAKLAEARVSLSWYADVKNYEEGEGPGGWVCEEQCEGECTCECFEPDWGERARTAITRIDSDAADKGGGGT